MARQRTVLGLAPAPGVDAGPALVRGAPPLPPGSCRRDSVDIGVSLSQWYLSSGYNSAGRLGRPYMDLWGKPLEIQCSATKTVCSRSSPLLGLRGRRSGGRWRSDTRERTSSRAPRTPTSSPARATRPARLPTAAPSRPGALAEEPGPPGRRSARARRIRTAIGACRPARANRPAPRPGRPPSGRPHRNRSTRRHNCWSSGRHR